MKPKPPEPPKHLSPAAREWFAGVVADYELEPHHLKLLALAAETWDRYCQARDALAANGLTMPGRYGQPIARPEVAIERDSRLAFARLLRELCLDLEPPAESRPPRRGGQA
jgi:phage terminase small subunit